VLYRYRIFFALAPLVAAAWPVGAQETPPAVAQEPPVVAQEALPVADAPKATIYIYRPSKFQGKTLEPDVFCDEKKVADMDNGRYFALKVDPGAHVVRSNEKDSIIDQDFEGGKVYYVKISILPGFFKGHGQIAPVSERQALVEMKKLKPLDKKNVEASAAEIVVLEALK